jgi:hypothetical protein
VRLASKIGLGEPVRSDDPQEVCEFRVAPVAIADFDPKFVVGWQLLQEWNEPIRELMSISQHVFREERKLKYNRPKFRTQMSIVSKNSAMSASQSTNTLSCVIVCGTFTEKTKP